MRDTYLSKRPSAFSTLMWSLLTLGVQRNDTGSPNSLRCLKTRLNLLRVRYCLEPFSFYPIRRLSTLTKSLRCYNYWSILVVYLYFYSSSLLPLAIFGTRITSNLASKKVLLVSRSRTKTRRDEQAQVVVQSDIASVKSSAAVVTPQKTTTRESACNSKGLKTLAMS